MPVKVSVYNTNTKRSFKTYINRLYKTQSMIKYGHNVKFNAAIQYNNTIKFSGAYPIVLTSCFVNTYPMQGITLYSPSVSFNASLTCF